jgi:hypothetical protein
MTKENISLVYMYVTDIIGLPSVVFPYGFIMISLYACVLPAIRVSYYDVLVGMCVRYEENKMDISYNK